MARLPELCHQANIAGLEKHHAIPVPNYKAMQVDNRPSEEEMLKRLRALKDDPAAQLMMFQIFTADMDFHEEIAFLEKV